MNNQKKLIIYNFNELFNILNELKYEFNYQIEKINSDKVDDINFDDKIFDLVINKSKIPNIKSQLTLTKFPIKISKLIEKINIKVLKRNFQYQSEIIIGKYKIDLNSREIFLQAQKLRLTEKESNLIIYLSKFNKPISINKLQKEVWGYQSDLETHTVETHIHRLRKKIYKEFADENFIVSDKNGYKIN